MPTYEYHCDACEHHFDEFQWINEEPLVECPKCGKRKLRRLFGSGAAVLFKGSGFYQTDYRSESYKAAAKADQQGANGTASAGKGDTTATGTAGNGRTSAAKTSKSSA